MPAAVFHRTLFLIVLTLVYLCFELGFNARLLDVVGGAPDPHDVERVEVYGRTLSGVAAALVALQIMLNRRRNGRPSVLRMAVVCLLTVALVYGGIKSFVDLLVATRDAEFRRTAFNSMLLQEALAKGQLALDGFVDDQDVFAQPEGKAFMALFPFLALSTTQLDERLSPLKDELIGNAVRQRKSSQQYYDDYVSAMKETHRRWQKYARIPVPNDEDLLHEQDKAWNDYLRSLSRHGWTPQTVPGHRRGTVVAKVRKQLAVPPGWDPADETEFRAAVERRYRKSVSGVQVGKDRIPPGLSYEQFVLRPGVQAELRKRLQLPAGARIAAIYRTPAEFRSLYEAMVGQQVRKLREQYDAPASKFEAGASWFEDGNQAARAVIVPPVALFFSLLGAIGHLSKLLYLLATLALLLRQRQNQNQNEGGGPTRRTALAASAVLVCTLLGTWTALSVGGNRITRSELFQQLVAQVRETGDTDDRWDGARKAAIANITHVVAVGQGLSYPVNEWIRTRVLHGMNYGYQPTPR